MTDVELTDATLEAWLAEAASAYDVPEHGVERVLEAAGESVRPMPVRRWRPRVAVAASVVVLAVAGGALWQQAGAGGRHASVTGVGPKAVSFTVHGSSGGGPMVEETPPTRAATPGQSVDAGAAASPHFLSGQPLPSAGVVQYQDSTGRMPLAKRALADGAKVVHTGTLALTVAKGQVTATLTRLTGLATGVGGYPASSSTAESGAQPNGTVVLRVPAAAFDSVLSQARTFGAVTATTSSGKDVTAEYTDQQAKLAALQASRGQFLTILAKAKTVGDTLAVQQQVNATQTQIDELQGQLKLLANQAAYATLTVTVSQKAPAAVAARPTHRNGLAVAWSRARDGFVTGVEALVARSGRALVVLLVLAVGLLALRLGWRLGRRRFV